jgi:hypothetical protein
MDYILMTFSLKNLITEVDQLSTSKPFENYLNAISEVDATQISSLSLAESRKLRLAIKRINKQFSEAAMHGGNVNDILGKHINNMQIKNAKDNPTDTVASQLAYMAAEIRSLKEANILLSKQRNATDSEE